MNCEEMAAQLATYQAQLAGLTDAYNTACARATATSAQAVAAMQIAATAANDEIAARNSLDQCRSSIDMLTMMMQMMNCPMPGNA